MQCFSQEVPGIDGSAARLDAYIIDNSEEIEPGRVRPSVLILPGGGYFVTSDREAEPVALKLIGAGYNAFILRYSTAPSRYPVAFLQAAEAISRIRANAREWNVDPAALVVLGFSAGGHLAGLLATAWDSDLLGEHGYSPQVIRPSGVALGYAALSTGPEGNQDCVRNLLGPQAADPVMVESLSIENLVNAQTPPSFLWHTVPDDVVPVANSLLYVQACLEAGVPVELHLYPQGGHGLSLGTRESQAGQAFGIEECVQSWFGLFLTWLRLNFPAR